MSTELVEIAGERQVKTREETTWYLSEEKKDKEVMSRVITWDDFDDFDANELGGSVKYWIHDKRLYNKILDYFNLERKKEYYVYLVLSSSEPIEFKRRAEEESKSFTDEPVHCYYRLYRATNYREALGFIEFSINCKNMFEKFVSFVMKFKP